MAAAPHPSSFSYFVKPSLLVTLLIHVVVFVKPVFSWGIVLPLSQKTPQTLQPSSTRLSLAVSTDNSINSNTDASSSALLPPAISVDALSCTHNGGETWQVKDVSFVLPQGAKAALIGINGSGKSTLLRILAESTCGDDSFVDTSQEGMKYTGSVSSPRTLKVAFVEQVRTSCASSCIRPSVLSSS